MLNYLPSIVVLIVYLISLFFWKRYKYSKENNNKKDEIYTKRIEQMIDSLTHDRDMYKDLYQKIHIDLLEANKKLSSLQTEVNLLREYIKKSK